MAWQINQRLAVAVAVGLGLAVAIAQSASAQGGGGGRGFGRMFGVSKARLATLEEVQTELKLSDEQKDQIEDINEQLREDRRGLFGGGFGQFSEIRTKMDELNSKASAEVDGKLDEDQRKRLQEIAIQVNGPSALNDPSVVDQLGLSDEQKKKLEAVRSENSQARDEAMDNSGELSREEQREKFRGLADTANEKLLGVLTDEQKTKFEEMKGKAIEIDPSSLFGGGGGGGGFGGGGGGGENR